MPEPEVLSAEALKKERDYYLDQVYKLTWDVTALKALNERATELLRRLDAILDFETAWWRQGDESDQVFADVHTFLAAQEDK